MQGSGASLALWLVVTILLIELLEKHSPGITFANLQRMECKRRVGEMYVNDANLWLALKLPPLQLVAIMQEVAQKWERYLFASGGVLALMKCFWYLIYWVWEDGVPRRA